MVKCDVTLNKLLDVFIISTYLHFNSKIYKKPLIIDLYVDF